MIYPDTNTDESYPDTALEIVESKDDQPSSNKYFNPFRGPVQLTRLNVEKKPKSSMISIKKPMVIIHNLEKNIF